jgi:ATP-dependent helicase/nuclease subunit A
MFIEDDGIVILDFKTDKIANEEDFIKVYKEQLDYYSIACEKIINMPVKERYIYSLYLGKSIKL